MLVLVRLCLGTIGYAKLGRLLSRFGRGHRSGSTGAPEDVDRIVWSVSAAGWLVLGPRPCLPLAMATQWLLQRRGFASDLRLGAMRDAAGRLEAHAWVERDGRILIGETPAMERFERLPVLVER